MPKLESAEVVLVHCNLVNNNYQQASKVLFTFWPNKQFWQLINIVLHSLTMLSTTNAEFSFIEVWFTDQNSEPFEIEDNFNLTLIFCLAFKKSDTQHNQNLGNTLKDMNFCHLQENLVINMVNN